MSGKRLKRREEDVGGERIAKQRPLRQRIRDTTRILSRPQLPETVRLTQERVLTSLQQDLAEKLGEKRTKRISKKYRMVKFFERRKACRKLKAKMKVHEDCLPEERAEIEEDIARIRKELNYIIHYPDDSKYQALYPSTETTSAKSMALRERRLAAIAERVACGELPDASLELCSGAALQRQGRVEAGESDITTTATTTAKPKERKKTRVVRIKAPVDEEPDSDSGMQFLCKDEFFLDVTGSDSLT